MLLEKLVAHASCECANKYTQVRGERPQTFAYLNQYTGSFFLWYQFAQVTQNFMSHRNPVCYQFHHLFFHL